MHGQQNVKKLFSINFLLSSQDGLYYTGLVRKTYVYADVGVLKREAFVANDTLKSLNSSVGDRWNHSAIFEKSFNCLQGFWSAVRYAN